MATTILLKRANSLTWQQANPVLLMGEPGYEKDTGRLKIGDGQTAWNDLPYVASQPLEGTVVLYGGSATDNIELKEE